MRPDISAKLNAAAIYAIAAALLGAFYFQLVRGELPCPLCLLQRVVMIALGIGPTLNLLAGPRPCHYGLALISALLGATIAGRHILLHIAPGDPGFGSAFLGYHMYTWAFVCFAAALVATALMLQFDVAAADGAAPRLGIFERAAIGLLIVIALLNAASAFIECGISGCPADPQHYQLL
jgi:disulfide bond formation protein DsbB